MESSWSPISSPYIQSTKLDKEEEEEENTSMLARDQQPIPAPLPEPMFNYNESVHRYSGLFPKDLQALLVQAAINVGIPITIDTDPKNPEVIRYKVLTQSTSFVDLLESLNRLASAEYL